MSKNGYLERQRKIEDAMFSAGRDTGMQYMADIYEATLNDKALLGDDALSAPAIRRLREAVKANADKYLRAFDIKDPEADYWQERLDAKLRKIWQDMFAPWAARYTQMRQCRYDKKGG